MPLCNDKEKHNLITGLLCRGTDGWGVGV